MAQTSLGGVVDIVGQPIFSSSATQQHILGSYTETQDGRGFRYFKNGAVAVTPGKVYQGPAQDTTNQNPSGGLAVAAAAVGDFTVTLTGTLTLAADQLAGGWMSVAVTPGLGYLYRVKGNSAVTAAANCLVTLEDPILVALTTSSKVVFQVNPYNGCVVAPATMTSTIVGVPVFAVAASQFGWMQTHGPASCLQTGTGTCGTALGVLQGGTIGSLAPAIAGTPIIAHAFGTNITGEYDLVNLVLD
jgi:hypothetical protein